MPAGTASNFFFATGWKQILSSVLRKLKNALPPYIIDSVSTYAITLPSAISALYPKPVGSTLKPSLAFVALIVPHTPIQPYPSWTSELLRTL